MPTISGGFGGATTAPITAAVAGVQADTDALQIAVAADKAVDDLGATAADLAAAKAVIDLGATAAALATVGTNVSTAVTRLGVPVRDTIALDIADVLAAVGTPATAAGLTALDAKIGTPVNTGGTATLAGILGDFLGNSAAAYAIAMNNTLGTAVNTGGNPTLADILGDPLNVSLADRLIAFATVKQGVRKGTYTDHWFHSLDLGSADPTDGDLTLPTTQGTSFTILAIKDLTIPEAAAGTITDVAYSVKWSGIVSGAGPKTGSTRLEMATSANTQSVGDVSTGTAITATQSETVATATRTISHHIRPSFLSGTGKVRIFLVGLVTDAGDTLTVNGFDTSELQVTYEVP